MQYTFSNRISSLKPSAIREILKATSQPGVIPFAAGNPPPESFPIDAIRRFISEILEEHPIEALQYGISEGYTPLRNVLLKRINESFSSVHDFDDLIIVSGAQQAVELTCKVFLNEGDTVICENPSFIGSLNAIRSYNVNLCGIELENDGIDITKLEKALTEEKNIKAIYLIPNFQNPTGITMSLKKRKAVYELAKKYSIIIIEDNPYGDLRFSGEELPTIKSMDTEGLVVYCGSFSKILSAGIRVGYALAPAQIIQKLVVAKQVSDVHTNLISQMLAERFLTQSDFESHIVKIKEIYRHKSSLMIDGIERHFDKRIAFTRPEGGLFLWCTLPQDVDMLDYVKRAAAKGVAVVPGVAFLTNPLVGCNSFRLNYSTPTDEQIINGIEILGGIPLNN